MGCQCGVSGVPVWGQWGAQQQCQRVGWCPRAMPLAAWAWQPDLEKSLAHTPISPQSDGSQRGNNPGPVHSCGHADILVSPTNPGAHTEQRILWVLRIHTSLAADLIVAVAACVQPGWVAPLVPGHLHWVFLEPPDKALHQTKLDQPPGDEEGRDLGPQC